MYEMGTERLQEILWFLQDKRDAHEGRMVVLARYCAGINKQVRTYIYI
jgi:hypothetical protein